MKKKNMFKNTNLKLFECQKTSFNEKKYKKTVNCNCNTRKDNLTIPRLSTVFLKECPELADPANGRVDLNGRHFQVYGASGPS